MKFFYIFSIIFLLTTSLALAYHERPSVGGVGFGSGIVGSQGVNFWSYPVQVGSGVYNSRRLGAEVGFNPFYARSTPSTFNNPNEPRGYVYLRNKLDYQVWRNPSLLTPRYSVNNDRYLSGFNQGFFTLYNRPRGVTGQIRSGLFY